MVIKGAGIFPTVDRNKGNLRLLRSQFGTGWLLDGTHPKVTSPGACLNKAHYISLAMMESRSWTKGALGQHLLGMGGGGPPEALGDLMQGTQGSLGLWR